MKEHKIIYKFPSSDYCFGCNDGPAEGTGVRAYATEDGYVVCNIHTKLCHGGFPGITHGGIISTYFDEVLWFATLLVDKNVSAMTVEMNIKYKKPTPLDTDIRVIAEPARVDGRHYYVHGYILLPDDSVSVTCDIHYIAVKSDNPVSEDKHCRSREPIYDFNLESVRF